jgi:membrane protein
VLVAVVIFAAISILLVAVPLALDYARSWLPLFADTLDVIFSWRIYGTLFVLTVGLLLVHLWLPAGRRRVYDVIPGVLLTLLLWLAGALIFAYYLATFANYTATYAGLASVMIVLIFLYMVGVIFIIGAEINAALMKFRVRAIFSRNFLSGQGSHKSSEPDKAADIGR